MKKLRWFAFAVLVVTMLVLSSCNRATLPEGLVVKVYPPPGVTSRAPTLETQGTSEVVYSQSGGELTGQSGLSVPGFLADDFTVPIGESWLFNEVVMFGSTSGSPFDVFVFADNGGLPGSTLYAFEGITDFTEISIDGFHHIYNIQLPATVSLSDGTYWLGFEVGTSFEFSWSSFDHEFGNRAAANTTGTWRPFSFDDDLYFSLLLNNSVPVCSAAFPSRASIVNGNERTFVPVSILGVSDEDGDAVAIQITGIRQDEPVLTDTKRVYGPDGSGVGSSVASVRAERWNKGNGRVYHIGFSATDPKGGSCTGEVLVSVPLSQNKVAVDGGAIYDSTTLQP